MSDYQGELDYERQVNAAYLAALEQRVAYKIAGARSKTDDPWGCLTARVRLASTPEDDTEFYIGPRALPNLEGVRVVSWAADAAAVHFHALPEWHGQQVLVRRVFDGRVDIKGFAQDPPVTDGPAFPRGLRRPSLPPANRDSTSTVVDGPDDPSGRRRTSTVDSDRTERLRREALERLRGRGKQLGLRPPDDISQRPKAADGARGSAQGAGPAVAPKSATLSPRFDSTEELLVKSLRAPRQGRLGHVLATLRPDQFGLIIRPPGENLIVEGHPGTGKSIVATHRAAWLANPHRPGPPLFDDILLIGPTESWQRHVSSSISSLTDGGRVRVLSLPSLLGSMIARIPAAGPLDGPFPSVSEETGAFIAQLVGHFRPKNGRGWVPTGYEQLRSWDSGAAGLRRDPTVDTWRRGLPAYSRAVEDLRLWPVLAYLAGVLVPPNNVAHIVVDEAQDIRPLEWMILSLFNPGAWTLVGDLNQRRAEHSYRDWTQVQRLLGGDWQTTVRLEKGYRSTQSIMDLAASVLPTRGGRTNAALGRGEPPVVLNSITEQSQPETLALRAALVLSSKYKRGTVALIYPHPQLLHAGLRHQGWWPMDHSDWWSYSPSSRPSAPGTLPRFRLLSPEQARGIEFDAVVILEPADFPKTTLVGHGTLYTAITRANREVVLVHGKRIVPAALADAVKRAHVRTGKDLFAPQVQSPGH